MALVKELRAQYESPWADSTSLASSSDEPPAPSRRRGRGGSPPKPDKQRTLEQLFGPEMFDKVWSWLEKLGIVLREREDLRQSVFLEAHRSFQTYDPERSTPERWLNSIAVHVAARYQKLARHRREILTPINPRGITDPSPNAEDMIATHQDRMRILELLQSIDSDLRAVLIAHEIDDIPIKEIARQRGMPLSTLYQWKARARRALKKRVKEQLQAEEARLAKPGRGDRTSRKTTGRGTRSEPRW